VRKGDFDNTADQPASMHHRIWRLVNTKEGVYTTQVLNVCAKNCEPFAIQLTDTIKLTLFLYQNKSAQDAPKHYQPRKANTSKMNREKMQPKSFHLFIENN
jgi:hypothetical protein